MDKTETRSTCCYCGVGCGVLIASENGRIVGVRGDPDHPANYGRLCGKGLSLAASAASDSGRALHPEMRMARDVPRLRVGWEQALDAAADRFADIIRRHGPDAVAFYASGQLLTEDYYLFNKLAKGVAGTNNIDTNSRLCMSSAVTAYKMAFGADGPPTCYEDLESAGCVLFAGSNMAYAHPVLFRRLEDARRDWSDARWIVVDPRRTDTAAMADLHLQIQPGTDVALFHGMLHHLIWEGLTDAGYIAAHTEGFDALKRMVRDYTPKMAAEICGVRAEDIATAAEWFGRSPASLSLYCMGLNQSSQGTAKNLALINLHLATGQIGRPGAGPFSLTGQPNAMGGREVGGMATMLAAHRDIANPDHRREVAAHWGVPEARLSSRPGLPAVAMFEALARGEIKAVWIVCTNPAHSLPDLAMARQALSRAELVVVQDAFAATDTTAFADILLPAASWGEKEGTVTNSERRVSRVRAAVPPPGEARPDGWIAAEFGRRLAARLHPGEADHFAYADAGQVFDEHRALTVGRDLDMGGLDYRLLEEKGPQQWPLPAGQAEGQVRRYVDGVFATDNGQARFHAIDYQPPAEKISAHYPFRLITGRLRDQWHGMSRTGRVPGLFSHSPEPELCMHPEDAERRNLSDGDLVRVASKRGQWVLPLKTDGDLARGCVFAAMHWSRQFLNSGGSNEATIPAVDGLSYQPELKHAAVRVEKAELPWRALVALRHPDLPALQARLAPLLGDMDYAAMALAGRDTLRLRAAGASSRLDWLMRVLDALALFPGPDVLEYRDDGRGALKRVAWDGDRLAWLVFAGDAQGDRDAGERLLQCLLDGEPWRGPRLAAFSPAAAGAARRDRIVCQCKQVGEAAILARLAQGGGVAELQAELGCGTVCGTCAPELARMASGYRQHA
ncbi:nitrate reductase [Chromobacterium violaceum]|uniref:nitrate reductase n=1 Tax=Chromobacterium violaceum TaxID=536 RepID=UPI000652BBB6|nr:nitrate reductase [Chromobacterium violaceum]KMN48999.1 nitrate reductase [Chromobacterium violaceum]KMN85156.1 nitrate reductase [Chromobacterium violaceum]KMN91726.1 nitrate reductase [Chromobacterium violaceum]KMO02916.1 nitrate reductase [Chromobacterium violaceum]